MNNRLVEKSRTFQATVDGSDSAYAVEDLERGTESRAAFKAGEYSYMFKGPFTNKQGQVSAPVAARIEPRLYPRDDGSWVNYLWLGFGSHHYFTSRVSQAVEPIWPTGLRESNESKLGLTASYVPLSNTCYPLLIAYMSDGYEYFEVKQTGALQRKRLRHPFDTGFTNIVLQLHSCTNLDGSLFPTEFEISRFGVQNMWQTNASLKLLVRSRVYVTSIERDSRPVAHPDFEGRVYALDARTSGSRQGSGVQAVHLPMTNGNWPDRSVAEQLYERQKKAAEQFKAESQTQVGKRKVVLVGLLMAAFLFPLILVWRSFRKKRVP